MAPKTPTPGSSRKGRVAPCAGLEAADDIVSTHGHGGHGHGHGHGHGPPRRPRERHSPSPARALAGTLALNAVFLVVETVAGSLTGSLALLSDAGHMVSDVASLAIAYLALQLAAREPSAEFTYGLRRAPVIGALVNGASLVGIVLVIVGEALTRLQDPPALDAVPVILVGFAGLAVNVGGAFWLERTNDRSVNTRGAMLHLLADALGSVAAIVAGFAVAIGDYRMADPIASLIIALLIGFSILPLLRDTLDILLQRAPRHIDVPATHDALERDPRVVKVTDLHVWALDTGQPILTVSLDVAVESLEASNQLADELRGLLAERFGIRHATIECRHIAAPEIPDAT